VEADTANYLEVGYCDIRNVRQKHIEFATTSTYCSAHHNFIKQESGFAYGNDHGIVMNAHHCEIYNNIMIQDKAPYTYAAFAIKVDGGTLADNNKIYNNLILKWATGLGVIDSVNGGNVFANNTVYLQLGGSGSHSSDEICCCCIDGTGGSATNNNIIENNIFYYPKLESAGSYATIFQLTASGALCSNNTIRNNICYYDGSKERGFVFGSGTARAISWFETNWGGSNGNVFQNNIVQPPGFVGGTHTVTNLPTGLDASWIPNDNGLDITDVSDAVDAGYSINASPYNVDIEGTSRPDNAYDIGAYEYSVDELSDKLVIVLK
jgi:hypothetical protein